MKNTIPDEPPLFVDLDGTLIKTDLLQESILLLLKKNPWLLFALPAWLLRGKASFKARYGRCQYAAVPSGSAPGARELVFLQELLPFR